jgi:adenylate cyclase
MDFLEGLGAWISANESLLSGIAAIIVVGGVILSPLGFGVRRFLAGGGSDHGPAIPEPEPKSEPLPEPAPPAARPESSPSSEKPSIAVLPFDNMSSDQEQEYLADGMTEDIITGLASNRHLFVVSRNSTFAYKGQSPDIRDVGRDLGVRYVLEGSVRRVGERLRTTAQLIESATGEHLWADRYDRAYSEMFEVQDEVIASITGALNAQINSAEFERASRAEPANMGAWEFVQRGVSMGFMRAPNHETSIDALESLRAAVELDPDYAYARSALAWILFSCAINGWIEDPGAAMKEGWSHLVKAMEDNSEDPLALFYAGAAYLYARRYEQALLYLDKSLDRNPHQPDALIHVGLAYGYLGSYECAHEYFDRAERMASTGGMSSGYSWYRAIILVFEERYEEAVALLEVLMPQFPRYATARVTLALAFAGMGRMDDAKAAIDRAARGDFYVNLEGLLLNIGAHPDPEKGRERVALVRRFWPDDVGV